MSNHEGLTGAEAQVFRLVHSYRPYSVSLETIVRALPNLGRAMIKACLVDLEQRGVLVLDSPRWRSA